MTNFRSHTPLLCVLQYIVLFLFYLVFTCFRRLKTQSYQGLRHPNYNKNGGNHNKNGGNHNKNGGNHNKNGGINITKTVANITKTV
jgi:hypothetical protein